MLGTNGSELGPQRTSRDRNRLNAAAVRSLTEPGRHGDGGGLYLVVKPSGTKSWVFIFRWRGRQPEMGLGSFHDVSLAEARRQAQQARSVLLSGRNPIDARRTEASATASAPTFGTFADQLVDALSPGFRNPKHVYQWTHTLGDAYCHRIRGKLIRDITTDEVLSVLTPIWTSKPETASRLRGRIERVLDAARTKGLRTGDNPARWKGHLDTLLPRPPKLRRGHHAAMPYIDVPAFMTQLRTIPTTTAIALRFTILTTARVSEVLNARWEELDLECRLWTVPAHRTKSSREHRVPLSHEALEILKVIRPCDPPVDPRSHVFRSKMLNKPLSNMTFAKLLWRMRLGHYTPHGFRSSFRDWAGEMTTYDRETCELALAHNVGNAVERAYRRLDSLEKRRLLMQEWALYLNS